MALGGRSILGFLWSLCPRWVGGAAPPDRSGSTPNPCPGSGQVSRVPGSLHVHPGRQLGSSEWSHKVALWLQSRTASFPSWAQVAVVTAQPQEHPRPPPRTPLPSTSFHLPPPFHFLYLLSPRGEGSIAGLSHRERLPHGLLLLGSTEPPSRGRAPHPHPQDCQADQRAPRPPPGMPPGLGTRAMECQDRSCPSLPWNSWGRTGE